MNQARVLTLAGLSMVCRLPWVILVLSTTLPYTPLRVRSDVRSQTPAGSQYGSEGSTGRALGHVFICFLKKSLPIYRQSAQAPVPAPKCRYDEQFVAHSSMFILRSLLTMPEQQTHKKPIVQRKIVQHKEPLNE
jgi:hypothetical protein